jgi:2-hydroxycyclohexanecarboxyl-CoA dehydrogenase
MFELKDKVAIVTGGARGIGKGISGALAAQGAKVVIADLILEEAEKNVVEIERGGGTSMAFQTDITDLEQVKAMVTRVRETYGPVDILVNNAGWDRIELFMKTTPDFWDKIIAINYRGVLNCIYSVVEDMMSRNSGKIISIGSDAGRVGSMGEAVYAGAKGAIIAFSKSLARELARYKINVNVICPGPTPTPMVEEMMEEGEFARKILSSIDKIVPLKRMGTPEDIANAVVFLASDEAAFITGQVLSVSGGLSMV